MNQTNDKLRGLLLALLMVTSVFAGTIALAGSAGAANTASNTQVTATEGPIEYKVPNGEIIVDVVFDQEISSATVDTIEVIDSDEVIVSSDTVGGNAVYTTGFSATGTSLRINLGNADAAGAGDLDLSGEATLRLKEIGTNDDSKNFSITTTSGSLIEEKTGGLAGNTGQDVVAYQGATIAVLATAFGDTDAYEIFSDGDFVRSGGSGNEMRVNAESTDDLATGTYNFSHGTETDNDGDNQRLTLRNLGLTATADDTSINRNEDESATVEAEITSTVQGRSVTAELVNSSDEVEQTAALTIGGDRSVDASFEVDADDTYTIRTIDDNTNITVETDAIVVSEVDGAASFTQSVFAEQRGDIAEFTVSLSNVESVDVAIGTAAGQSDIGYGATLTDVNDTDGDGEVTLELNTFAPNQGVNSDAITVTSDDDEIEGGVTTTGTATALDAGTYDVNVSINNQEEDVATLSLLELSADGFTVLTGPPENDIEDASAISEFDAFEAAGNLTATSSIASKDIVVHKIEASGLGGAIANARSSGADDEQAFQALLNTDDVRLNITQTDASTGANQDNKKLLVTNPGGSSLSGASSDEFGALDNVNVVLDETNDTYYFNFPIVRGGDIIGSGEISDEDEFVANLTLVEGDLFDENVSVTQTFSVNNRSVELDETGENADGDDIITVAAATGQTVTGETNLAPGSEIEVRARATGDDPFLLSQTVDTDANREFSATFDLSSIAVGTNFTFTATSAEGGTEELDGELVAQVTETETATPEPTATATATPEPTATETATEEPTATETPGQPGFGIIVALLAFMAAALLAIRRD